MKTAVEWLEEQTRKPEWHSLKRQDIFEQAKEMEKIQIETSFEEGMFHHTNGLCPDEYYNETFKSK